MSGLPLRVPSSFSCTMNRSVFLHLLFVVVSGVVLGACGQGGSGPPFPVDSQQDWQRYLQGTWEYTGTTVMRSDDVVLSTDSVFYRVSFEKDTMEVTNKDIGGSSVNVGHAVCLVEYGSPPEFDVEECIRAKKYSVWRGDAFNREKGDTTAIQRSSAPVGSPKAKRLAADISDALPNLRASTRDSLMVGYGNGKGFYLTRQEPRGWMFGILDSLTD